MDTKTLMVALRPEINAVLAEIAKKHNLKSLHLGNGTFSSGGNFQWKLEGVSAGGLDKDADRYVNSTSLLGLPPLGTEFVSGSRTFKTSGINTTGTKVIATCGTQRYTFPVDVVIRLCPKVAA